MNDEKQAKVEIIGATAVTGKQIIQSIAFDAAKKQIALMRRSGMKKPRRQTKADAEAAIAAAEAKRQRRANKRMGIK